MTVLLLLLFPVTRLSLFLSRYGVVQGANAALRRDGKLNCICGWSPHGVMVCVFPLVIRNQFALNTADLPRGTGDRKEPGQHRDGSDKADLSHRQIDQERGCVLDGHRG